MTNGTIARVAALAGVLFLAGCLGLAGGGGGGGDTLSTEDIERVRSDPRIVGLTGIFERADTLLIPGVHLEVSSTIRGRSRSEEFAFRGQCSGTECDVRDGGTRLPITLDDLMIDDLVRRTEVNLTKAELGKRGRLRHAGRRGPGPDLGADQRRRDHRRRVRDELRRLG